MEKAGNVPPDRRLFEIDLGGRIATDTGEIILFSAKYQTGKFRGQDCVIDWSRTLKNLVWIKIIDQNLRKITEYFVSVTCVYLEKSDEFIHPLIHEMIGTPFQN